jgi:ParB-like chromosome segregation protein Spo0J
MPENHNIRPEIAEQAVPIDSVTPHPRNVRKGDLEKLAESLQTHGQYRAIIVQESTGHIIAGNHTWKACRDLNWTHIAATFLNVSDDQALRMLLIDNRTSDLAEYDDQDLAQLLKELQQTGSELDGTGYENDDLTELLEKLADQADTSNDDDLEPPPARTGLIECPECHHIWRADNHGEPV